MTRTFVESMLPPTAAEESLPACAVRAIYSFFDRWLRTCRVRRIHTSASSATSEGISSCTCIRAWVAVSESDMTDVEENDQVRTRVFSFSSTLPHP